MKVLVFASRNNKEILRDKINLAFGLGFPIILLLLLTAIQSNIPAPLFELDSLTPGIAVFGLSFISLFSGMLIAKDRESSFMLRLFTSPLKASHFIFGYTLPLLPIAITQIIVCFIVAIILGLTFNLRIIFTIIVLIPAAIVFIALGLLCGSLFTDKQVGGVCGALLTNLSAWLSGTWFDLDLIGGIFKQMANVLPFYHSVEAGRAAIFGNYNQILPHLIWVIAYAVILFSIAIIIFTKKMSSDRSS